MTVRGEIFLSFEVPDAPPPPGPRLPARILVHRAAPLVITDEGSVIEGEREERVTEATDFPCVLFPAGSREAGRGGRRIETPILLMTGVDILGGACLLHRENRIRMTSWPGLDERDAGDYQVDGEPLPLGKPGQVPRGYEVNLRRVTP